MIELGISTASFYPMLTEDSVSNIIQLGYRKAEVFINSECEFAPDYIKDLRARFDDGGIDVVSVHPYTSAIEALYFFTEYPRRAEDALNIYRRYFAMANVLGAKYFTFHGDRSIIGGNVSSIPKDIHIEVLAKMADIAHEYGVTVTQENVSWCASQNPEYLRMLRDNLGDKIGFTLDIKQACRAKIPLSDYIDAMGERLLNVHISDNNVENSCLLPGDGTLDFRKFVEKLLKIGYSGALILEVYSSVFDTIRQIEGSKSYLEDKLADFLKKQR